MATIYDERVREACTFLSATTLRLDGAVARHTRFQDAKRRDGANIQSTDDFWVTVQQDPAGFAVCRAIYNDTGATKTLTLDGAKIKKSSAGASLPAFDPAGAAGEVFITFTADDALFDTGGNLLSPDLFRLSQIKQTILGAAGFVSELGTKAFEAIAALGRENAGDGLGGVFWFDQTSSETADNEDVFNNIHTATGRIVRLPMKPWRTYRGANIAAGNLLTLLDLAPGEFPAGTPRPARLHDILVWSADGAQSARATALGHASAPTVTVEWETAGLAFELSGASLGVRNTTNGALTLSHIRPVIG